MAVSIESAYLGDEKSRTNVTSSVRSKLNDGNIEVLADSKLLPLIQLEGDVKLSPDDIKVAKENAQSVCGGSNDATCIEMKTQEFSRQRLAEKENEKVSSANIVKGRRLTVTYKQDGKKYTVEVPEGQTFKLEGGKIKKQEVVAPTGPSKSFTVTGPLLEALKILTTIVGTGLYAFSILITYRSFIQSGYQWMTYIATAAAVLVPYSGFLIVLGFFGLREFIKNMPVKKQ